MNESKCGHGIPLLSGECADCTGPMTDAELDLIRRRLVGHDGCYPKCDRAPSSETARLIATIVHAMKPPETSPAPGARGVMLYGDDRVMVCRVTLEPGAEWPEETHPEHIETIATVRGILTVEGADCATVAGGHTCNRTVIGVLGASICAGSKHTIREWSGAEPAEYISVLRRA